MNFFRKKTEFDFLGKRNIAFAVSGILIAISVVTPIFVSPNWGVDFAGGTEMQVRFTTSVDPGDVRKALEEAGIDDAQIQVFGAVEDKTFLVRMGRASLFSDKEFETTVEPKLREALPNLAAGTRGVEYSEAEGDQITVTAEDGSPLSEQAVTEAFEANGWAVQEVRAIVADHSYAVVFRGIGDKVERVLDQEFADDKPVVERVDQVGASVGNELKLAAVKSILMAVFLILLYVGFRFDFRFAPGGVIALAHDAVLVVGFYLVSGAEVNSNTIAAVLTIVGFSINDTIVIFDRVRENMVKFKGTDLYKLVNLSLNETLSRTILTSLTLLLSLIGLVVFTTGTLRDFSMAMSFGVIAGSYSSIYLASPFVIWMDKVLEARKVAAAASAASATR